MRRHVGELSTNLDDMHSQLNRKFIRNVNSIDIVLLLDTGVIDWQQMGNYCGTLCIQQGRRGKSEYLSSGNYEGLK